MKREEGGCIYSGIVLYQKKRFLLRYAGLSWERFLKKKKFFKKSARQKPVGAKEGATAWERGGDERGVIA